MLRTLISKPFFAPYLVQLLQKCVEFSFQTEHLRIQLLNTTRNQDVTLKEPGVGQ